jgi:hypothetical protein
MIHTNRFIDSCCMELCVVTQHFQVLYTLLSPHQQTRHAHSLTLIKNMKNTHKHSASFTGTSWHIHIHTDGKATHFEQATSFFPQFGAASSANASATSLYTTNAAISSWQKDELRPSICEPRPLHTSDGATQRTRNASNDQSQILKSPSRSQHGVWQDTCTPASTCNTTPGTENMYTNTRNLADSSRVNLTEAGARTQNLRRSIPRSLSPGLIKVEYPRPCTAFGGATPGTDTRYLALPWKR